MLIVPADFEKQLNNCFPKVAQMVARLFSGGIETATGRQLSDT